MPRHFPLRTLCSCHIQRVEVFIGVASLNGDHYTDRKSTVFPFIARCFGSEVDRGPGGQQERTSTGNEVLSGAAVSLCSRRAQLCLWLLFDPNGTQGGAVWLGGAGVGAQRTDGVVTGATQATFGGGGGERPRLVILAKRARAEVTEGRSRGAADAAVMPRTFPTSCTQTHRLSWKKSCRFKPTQGSPVKP